MKKITLTSVFILFAFVSNLFANEVNIFSARHYDSDVQLYEKFTAKTGIKVAECPPFEKLGSMVR